MRLDTNKITVLFLFTMLWVCLPMIAFEGITRGIPISWFSFDFSLYSHQMSGVMIAMYVSYVFGEAIVRFTSIKIKQWKYEIHTPFDPNGRNEKGYENWEEMKEFFWEIYGDAHQKLSLLSYLEYYKDTKVHELVRDVWLENIDGMSLDPVIQDCSDPIDHMGVPVVNDSITLEQWQERKEHFLESYCMYEGEVNQLLEFHRHHTIEDLVSDVWIQKLEENEKKNEESKEEKGE